LLIPAREPEAGTWKTTMYNYRKLEPDHLEFVSVAAVEELGEGERLLFDIEGRSVVLFRISDSYFAIDNVCSHDHGPVASGEIDGNEIECPRHGARFDLSSGKALTLPAVEDIASYPVRVDEDQILIGLPLE
jgi:3-phenylpropionate/trans-cinnamate dioxygenase ferredoxin subunit